MLIDAPCAMAMLDVEAVVLTLHVPVFDHLVVGSFHVIQLEFTSTDLIGETSCGCQHELFGHPCGTCRLVRLIIVIVVKIRSHIVTVTVIKSSNTT